MKLFKAIANLFGKKPPPQEQIKEPLQSETPQSVPAVPAPENVVDIVQPQEPIAPTLERQDEILYKIYDKNGGEMPEHYSGRNRTYDEAKKMVDMLNVNGEYRPYIIVEEHYIPEFKIDYVKIPIEERQDEVYEGDKGIIEKIQEAGVPEYKGATMEDLNKAFPEENIFDVKRLNANLNKLNKQAKKQEFFNDRSHWPSGAKHF